MPAWLSEVPGMQVRSYNTPWLNACKEYLSRSADEVTDLQVMPGRSFLTVQVENEYGSYGDEHAYTEALADIMRAAFDVPLYNNDGEGQSYLERGQAPSVLAEIDGSPQSVFQARNKYVTKSSSLGPLLDGEYYTTWLDLWASNYTHQTDEGDAAALQPVYSGINWILSHNDSFGLHGGTKLRFRKRTSLEFRWIPVAVHQ